jgi:hypothetical protein
MTVTTTKIDSSHGSGKNFTTWARPASTTIIYNNSVLVFTTVQVLFQRSFFRVTFYGKFFLSFENDIKSFYRESSQ